MIYYPNDVALDRLKAFSRAIDSHASLAGKLRIYTGTMPLNGGEITTQVLLANLEFPKPCLGDFSGRQIELLKPLNVLAVANGLAAWGRITSGGGDFVLDLSVGLVGSGAPLQLVTNTDPPSLDVYSGGVVSVLSIILSE